MKIQAFAAEEKGEVLKPYSYEGKVDSPMDCLIEVETCGVCHSDIHMIDNHWRISRYPLVPGHEVVGRIIETGKFVGHLKVGDRVGVGWQSGACLECEDCIHGNENLCDQSKSTIVNGKGGFAESLIVDSRFAFKIPEKLSSTSASPLLCGGITVYSALKYAGMKPGGHVGIIGIGGLGHMAVQFASKLGNTVTVFTTSSDKAEFAEKMGAKEIFINPTNKNKVKRKLDIILNTTHTDLNWEYYLKQLNSDGTLSFVGVPPSPLSIPVGSLLGKRKRVMASPIGGRGDIDEMLRIAAEQNIFPIIEIFPKTEINTAIKKVRNNEIRYRAVVDMKL